MKLPLFGSGLLMKTWITCMIKKTHISMILAMINTHDLAVVSLSSRRPCL